MLGTLRARLALLYGSVFLATGALLLGFVAVAFWSGKSVTSPVGSDQGPAHIVAAHQHRTDLALLLGASVIGLIILGVVSYLLGWIIAGRALRPLKSMVNTARAISASSLHSRIGLNSPYREFQELGGTLDALFGRLEAAFDSQRHFVANASHELRTPLTAERALLQVTLADPDADADTLRAACREVLSIGAAQERLIESLLTLASSEQGVEQWEPLDLGAVAAETVLTRRDDASGREVRIDTALAESPITGDPRLMESLVANLVDNAIRHNRPGGHVEIKVADGTITVRNSGAVIPPEEMDRLFVPFQRLRRERMRHADGHGLGLAIVRAIATAHGATITASTRPEGGLDIAVAFPAVGAGYAPASNSATPVRPRITAT
ncbi:MAG TPA: ATP-binding protein [Micromonosporaceae bacterium]|jgi:signal transduction histidine kinase